MVLEIEKAIKTLEKGGVIIYPSDTIWALGCCLLYTSDAADE